ncbi:MAG: 50S ribosomal protein L25 [Anaerolineaceae bacterium]|jgi:large subunit ribosomal protein L25|nr:50S ribosomal protein L25 [Anaerolineaceae bacterium]
MEKNVIEASKRSVTGKKVSVLRREGKLPGVVYGHKFTSEPIVMDSKAATKVLNSVTSSSIVTLVIDGEEHAALVREKQRDYIRNQFIHIDFQAVSQTEKIRTKVGITLTGFAPAVKDFNGVVVEGIDSIEVEALPKDLPEQFVIDVSHLANIGDAIYVKDIAVPANVEVMDSPEERIVLIASPAAEEVEPEPAAAEGEVVEPEVIEKGKKDEDAEDDGK